MKFVIQRVSRASVTVDGEVIGKIDRGYMVLIGVCDADDEAVADKMVDKMIKLRINEDAEGKTNLSLADVDGGLLLISQFTLYANCKKGNRPSFIEAGSPNHALRIHHRALQGAGAGGGKRQFRSGDGGRARQRRPVYHIARLRDALIRYIEPPKYNQAQFKRIEINRHDKTDAIQNEKRPDVIRGPLI